MKIQRKILMEVPPGQKKLRIDKYLASHVENSSRTKIRTAIDDGCVLVNSKAVKSNYLVHPNDKIDITLPNVEEKKDIEPENILLEILFEDEYILVVNKPAGMVTHPAYKNYSGTLVNALLHYMKRKDEALSSLNGFERAGIVHRLDKLTSGILVVAKDEETHRKLSNLFTKHDIEREYEALVWAMFKKKEGVIDKPLARSLRDRKKVAIVETGKHAVTEYKVLNEFDFLSHVRLKLHTGRTHQIRVHLHSVGHPVFGDADYDGRKPHGLPNLTTKLKQQITNLLELMPRQALHAKVLGFVHPRTGEKMRFESELPRDMKEVMKKLI